MGEYSSSRFSVLAFPQLPRSLSVSSGVEVGSPEGDSLASLLRWLLCHTRFGPLHGEIKSEADQRASVSRNAYRHFQERVCLTDKIIRFQDMMVKFLHLSSPFVEIWQQILDHITSVEHLVSEAWPRCIPFIGCWSCTGQLQFAIRQHQSLQESASHVSDGGCRRRSGALESLSKCLPCLSSHLQMHHRLVGECIYRIKLQQGRRHIRRRNTILVFWKWRQFS